MRLGCIVLAFFVALNAASASLVVDVTLSDRFVLESFTYSGDPGVISFELPSEPASVSSDHPFVVDGRTITIEAFDPPVTFSALFDDLIVSSGSERVFRSSFSSDALALSVTLPESAVLIDMIPAGDLSTDGSRTTISYPESSEISVAVFYSVPNAFPWLFAFAFSIPVIASFVFFAMYRTRQGTVRELVSSDECSVLDLIDGSRTQIEIARELSFSKSKMSKVVRKLEEKGLVRKEPHFKTNRLVRR